MQQSRIRSLAAFLALCAVLALLAAPALAQTPPQAQAKPASSALEIMNGQSVLHKVPFPVDKVAIGNPEVCGVVKTSDTELLVNAKKPGISNIIFWGAGGEKLEMSVLVRSASLADEALALQDMLADVEGVQVKVAGQKLVVEGEVYSSADYDKVHRVLERMPEVINQVGMSPVMKRIVSEQIRKEIDRAGVVVKVVKDSFVLDGMVLTQEESERASKIAGLYGRNVVNALKVTPDAPKPYTAPRLVEVSMNVMEVSRNALQDMGVYWNPDGSLGASGSYGSGAGGGGGFTGALTGTLTNLFPKMRKIQDQGQGRSLMQQAVITKEGGSAVFFAGTEVPIPIAQGSGTMSVNYKKVGVTLNISPTIDPNGNVDTTIQIESSTVSGEGMGGAPIISTSNLATALNVKGGNSVVLGGLIGQRELSALSGSPPEGTGATLAQANKGTKSAMQGMEAVIFVTPRVVEKPSDAVKEMDTKAQGSFKKKELEDLRKQMQEQDQKKKP